MWTKSSRIDMENEGYLKKGPKNSCHTKGAVCETATELNRLH
ncbi:hypothetical protein [Fodinibius salinus]|nr:hypothetical protein [Fodinibius salinus]